VTRLRNVLVLGVVVVAGVGGLATAWVVHQESPAALRSVLAVQAGAIVSLAVSVWVLLHPTVSRLDDLVEALRAFARGERKTRVHPADFAGLADVARAVNDVGASLCENDDPNLGPVQRRVREKPVRPPSEEPRPSAVQPERPAPARILPRRPLSEGDEVGEVRRRQRPKPSPSLETEASSASSTSSSSSSSSASSSPSLSSPLSSASSSSALSTTSSPSATELVTPPLAVSPPALVEPPLAASTPTPAPIEPPSQDEPGQPTPTPTSTPTTADSGLPAPATAPPQPITGAEGVAEPRVSRKSRRKAKRAASMASTIRPTSAADPRIGPSDADEPAAPAASPSSPSPDDAVAESATTVLEPAPPPAMPTRDDLQRLFNEFLREKRASGQGETLDVDFDAFAETIVGETERLIVEHRCRGVRFEVAVADGEVSLRPRLLR
jgi:hypothetical protein